MPSWPQCDRHRVSGRGSHQKCAQAYQMGSTGSALAASPLRGTSPPMSRRSEQRGAKQPASTHAYSTSPLMRRESVTHTITWCDPKPIELQELGRGFELQFPEHKDHSYGARVKIDTLGSLFRSRPVYTEALARALQRVSSRHLHPSLVRFYSIYNGGRPSRQLLFLPGPQEWTIVRTVYPLVDSGPRDLFGVLELVGDYIPTTLLPWASGPGSTFYCVHCRDGTVQLYTNEDAMTMRIQGTHIAHSVEDFLGMLSDTMDD